MKQIIAYCLFSAFVVAMLGCQQQPPPHKSRRSNMKRHSANVQVEQLVPSQDAKVTAA